MIADAVISVRDLKKAYRTPFRRKRVDALRGVSFEVGRGEIYGFLGPNGAGKTTTIRTLMGLIRATGGEASILGHRLPSRAARARVGFLPEQPYFYDYLTVAELLDLMGRLCGVDATTRKKRANELIARVGLDRAKNTSLKKYSKGMMQRAGLAQALMNDPEVIVLDEPMSGLDPIGRKEIRDLILEQRDRGKTVFFSTHILADVEAVADRIAIVARGQIQVEGVPSELVGHAVLGVDVTLRIGEQGIGDLPSRAKSHRLVGRDLILSLAPDTNVDEVLAQARTVGASVISVTPNHETLEDLFLRQIAAASDGGGAGVGARQEQAS